MSTMSKKDSKQSGAYNRTPQAQKSSAKQEGKLSIARGLRR